MKEEKKKAGIIGDPLTHSISPAMHNAAFDKLGLPFRYELLFKPSDHLPSKLEELRSEEYIGFNVTIPFKEAVIPFLDEVKEPAKTIGAVNTVKNNHGKLIGYNTDAPGFLASLKEDANFDPTDKKVVVLGAGGASRAVTISLLNAGIKEVVICDIVHEKAIHLSEYLNTINRKTKTAFDAGHLYNEIQNADLLVNTTPIGMYPHPDESPLPKGIDIHSNILIYDLVYNPHKTKLMQDAEKAKAKTASGLGMLIRQGALAFEIFTGRPAPYEVMKLAAYRELRIS